MVTNHIFNYFLSKSFLKILIIIQKIFIKYLVGIEDTG